MAIRLTARVTGQLSEPRVKHFHGLPPELTHGKDQRQELPWPELLLIESKPDGIFLFRFMRDGRVVGDTWHSTVEEAKEQASFEFENVLSEWRAVPDAVEDVVAFGLGE